MNPEEFAYHLAADYTMHAGILWYYLAQGQNAYQFSVEGKIHPYIKTVPMYRSKHDLYITDQKVFIPRDEWFVFYNHDATLFDIKYPILMRPKPVKGPYKK